MSERERKTAAAMAGSPSQVASMLTGSDRGTPRIPPAQERRLLSKHLTGDFGRGTWQTIDALHRRGMIRFVHKFGEPVKYGVSDLGRAYCDEHHLAING